MALFEVKNLAVTFDTPDRPVKAVRGISFAVAKGESVAIVGESGSGKSQTMMAAMGLLAANGRASGEVRYRGANLIGLSRRRLNGIPAALEEIWLDASYADTLGSKGLSESLYLTYQAELGLRIQRVEDRISVRKAPDWGQGIFPVIVGNPTGFVERKSWDQDGKVAEISSTWFDSEKAVYVSRLK